MLGALSGDYNNQTFLGDVGTTGNNVGDVASGAAGASGAIGTVRAPGAAAATATAGALALLRLMVPQSALERLVLRPLLGMRFEVERTVPWATESR